MRQTKVAQRYSKALFDLAIETGTKYRATTNVQKILP
jgi:F0F1-type ATP synthase delta subunit